MDEYEVIYLDDDERNAFVKDHRRPGGRRPIGGIMVPPSRRPTIVRPRPVSGGAVYDRQPAQVVVHQQPSRMGIAGLTTGELIELAAQLLAALQPLPGAPSALGHVETDVENLVIYQTALASHAKRDEQLRTLGNLIGKLLR
jgi:hypothetical protein